jgi:hypothetical protein
MLYNRTDWLYKRTDWSRPIIILTIMTTATLADVRALVEKHLPAEYRAKIHLASARRAACARRAGKEDAAEVAAALQIVLQLEGIKTELSA